MNKVLDNILTRRSCRAFLDKPIGKEELELIMKGAIYAPSAMNRQTWKFTVLQNKEKMAELATIMCKLLNKESYDFYKPAVMIFVSNDKQNANGLADCACAMQNIFLGAHSLGISSCWVNQMKDVCDHPDIRKVLNELKVPKNHIIWATAVLGYAATPAKKITKNKEVIVYI